MKGRSALPRTAFLVGLLVVVAGGASVTWGRRTLTRVPAFKARTIEVVGARWLAPDAVLRRAAIGRQVSVWQDFSSVEVALARHPLIEDAEVHRVGLNTIRIVVREVTPLALVGVPDLRPVRSDGTLLPIDPLQAPLDLPVLTAPAEIDAESKALKDGAARRALEMFARLRDLDPGLAAVVSDFDLAASDGLMANLLLSQPARRLALPSRMDEKLVERVRATLADLRNRGVEASLIEARYADQVVVRLSHSSRESGRPL